MLLRNLISTINFKIALLKDTMEQYLHMVKQEVVKHIQ